MPIKMGISSLFGGINLRFIIDDAICVDNKIYIFTRDFNLFYVADLSDGRLLFFEQLPEADFLEKRLVSKIIFWNNELYFIPFSNNDIWIYLLESREWEKIEIKKQQINYSSACFQNAVIYKDSMFLFGGRYPSIIKIDLITKAITYISKPIEEKNKLMKEKIIRTPYFRGKPLRIENMLYLASCMDNSVLLFNMDNCDYQWIEVGSKENTYSGIEKRGMDFWIAPRQNSPIVKWDGKDGVVEYKLDKISDLENIYFADISKRENDLIIYAFRNKCFSLLISKNDEIKKERHDYSFYKEIDGECIYQNIDGRIHYREIDGIEKIYENDIEDVAIRRLLQQIDKEKLKVEVKEGNPCSIKLWMELMFNIKMEK